MKTKMALAKFLALAVSLVLFGFWGRVFPAASAVAGAAPAAARSPVSEGILARTLEAARQEKRVVRFGTGGALDVATIKEHEAAFNRKYLGLNARIELTPSDPSYTLVAQKMLQEQKARVGPSFDVVYTMELVFPMVEDVVQQRGQQAFLRMERELLTKETPAEALVYDGLGVISHQSYYVLLYNPKLVPPEKAPVGYRDLADPKWKGKFQLLPHSSIMGWYALQFGKQEGLEIARKLGENKPILEFFGPAMARFTTGELPIMGVGQDDIFTKIKAAGVPVALGTLEATLRVAHTVHVNKDAPSPNTAKLFAAFMGSPESAAIKERTVFKFNYFYPVSRGREIANMIKSQEREGKTKIYNLLDHMDYPRWLTLTKEGKEYSEKVVQLLRGG